MTGINGANLSIVITKMVLVTVPRALARSSISPARAGLHNLSTKAYLQTHSRWTPMNASSIALTPYKPCTSALVRYASKVVRPILPPIDKEREAAYGRRLLRAHPERVSSESTTHPIFHEIVEPPPRPDPDMMAGINGDLVRSYITVLGTRSDRISALLQRHSA